MNSGLRSDCFWCVGAQPVCKLRQKWKSNYFTSLAEDWEQKHEFEPSCSDKWAQSKGVNDSLTICSRGASETQQGVCGSQTQWPAITVCNLGSNKWCDSSSVIFLSNIVSAERAVKKIARPSAWWQVSTGLTDSSTGAKALVLCKTPRFSCCQAAIRVSCLLLAGKQEKSLCSSFASSGSWHRFQIYWLTHSDFIIIIVIIAIIFCNILHC